MKFQTAAIAISWLIALQTDAPATALPSAIPDSLLINVNSIVINEETTFEVFSVSQAIKKSHREILILNEEGAGAGSFEEYTDQFRTLSNIEIIHYSAEGTKIKRYGKGDLRDNSALGDHTLINDQRRLSLSVSAKEYPYRVSIDYAVTYSGFITIPVWYPQDIKQSVVEAHYSLISKPDYNYTYRFRNHTVEVRKEAISNKSVQTWSVRNIPSFNPENYGYGVAEQSVSLHIIPTEFSIDGYEGSQASWKAFGLWYYELSKDRQKLPTETIQKINGLVTGIDNPVVKTKKIYDYLQKNTRYVNIALGIGGWQPLSATFVAENGYGDCKALTNYMQALLASVGIEAFPALVAANNGDIDPKLPGNQFNHVILMVPIETDTIWLECTSQHLPFNFLSSFTEDRHALLIKPEGGYIVKTPATDFSENLLTGNFSVDLSTPGNITAELSFQCWGNEAIAYHLPLAELSDEKKTEAFSNITGLPHFSNSKFTYGHFNKEEVTGTLGLNAVLTAFIQQTPTRIFFCPFVIPVWISAVNQDNGRKSPMVFEYPFTNKYHGIFKLPSGYTPHSLPEDLLLENDFMVYHSKFKLQGSEMEVQYEIILKEKTIPAIGHNEFSNLVTLVAADQMKKIVLIKK